MAYSWTAIVQIKTTDETRVRARARALWSLTRRSGTWRWHLTSRRQAGVRAGSFAEPRRGPAAAARSEPSRARRVAASTVASRLVRRRRRVVHVSPRPSACGGAACARVMGSYWKNRDMTLVSDQPSPRRRRGRLLCGAKTRAHGCCQVRAEPGKARCRFHGGKSTGPKTQAGRARIAEAQRRRWRAFRESLQANAAAGRTVDCPEGGQPDTADLRRPSPFVTS
jgi:hypothetical protein